MGSPAAHTEPAARDVLARAGISKRNKRLFGKTSLAQKHNLVYLLTVFPLGDRDVKLIVPMYV